MKMKFKISKLLLARDVFSLNNYCRREGKKLTFPYWVNIENQTWKKFCNDPAYYFINSIHTDWAIKEILLTSEKEDITQSFRNTSAGISRILKEILKSSEFKRLYKETEEYKKFVEKQWKNNEKIVFDYFENVLGLKLPGHAVDVYIFHPKSFNGNANWRRKTITWGHSEDWKNYSTVYLAHEILHILTSPKMKDHKIMHAIIELATDNELRIRLNGRGDYFKEKNLPVGHRELQSIEKKILPLWEDFLRSDKKENIFSLEARITKRIDL